MADYDCDGCPYQVNQGGTCKHFEYNCVFSAIKGCNDEDVKVVNTAVAQLDSIIKNLNKVLGYNSSLERLKGAVDDIKDTINPELIEEYKHLYTKDQLQKTDSSITGYTSIKWLDTRESDKPTVKPLKCSLIQDGHHLKLDIIVDLSTKETTIQTKYNKCVIPNIWYSNFEIENIKIGDIILDEANRGEILRNIFESFIVKDIYTPICCLSDYNKGIDFINTLDEGYKQCTLMDMIITYHGIRKDKLKVIEGLPTGQLTKEIREQYKQTAIIQDDNSDIDFLFSKLIVDFPEYPIKDWYFN